MKTCIVFGALLSVTAAAVAPHGASVRTAGGQQKQHGAAPAAEQQEHQRQLVECAVHLEACQANLTNYSLPQLLYNAVFPNQPQSPSGESAAVVEEAAVVVTVTTTNITTNTTNTTSDDHGGGMASEPGKKPEPDNKPEPGNTNKPPPGNTNKPPPAPMDKEKKDDEEDEDLVEQVLNGLLFIQAAASNDTSIQNMIYLATGIGGDVLNSAFALFNVSDEDLEPIVAALPQGVAPGHTRRPGLVGRAVSRNGPRNALSPLVDGCDEFDVSLGE
jgi:hypothetical protein